MKGSVAWKGLAGGDYAVEAEYTEKMALETSWSDGYVIERAKKPAAQLSMMTIYKAGVKIDDCWNPACWACVEISNKDLIAKGITHKIGERAGVTREVAAQIDAMLKNVIEGGKRENPDVAAFYDAQNTKKAEKARKNAEWVIAEAEKSPKNADGTLMNDKQAAAYQKAFNNVMNEGAEGYVPDVITQNQYDAAMKLLGK